MRWLTSSFNFMRARSGVELTLAFALATFVTCLLVLVPLFIVFLTGDLGDQLDGLDSLVGIALFALLWLTTFASSVGAVADVGIGGLRADTMNRTGLYGVKWGATNGVAFLLILAFALVLAGAAIQVAEGKPDTALFVWVFGVIVAVIGGAVAAVVGAALGAVAALIETPLILLARRIAEEPPVAQEDAPAE